MRVITPEKPGSPLRQELLIRLEAKFRELSLLLYDTTAAPAEVDAAIRPYLDAQVRFVDPWQEEDGEQRYRLGAAGFHALFSFRLELHQAAIQLDDSLRIGRAMLDGVMNLTPVRWLPAYPLRTILVYDFTVDDPHTAAFKITSHEEMWSFGDMIAATPLLGRFYTGVFRKAFAQAFLGASWLACRARGMLPPLHLR